MNQVIISGQLTKDPIIYNEDQGVGKMRAYYCVAVKNNSTRSCNETNYIGCTAFGPAAAYAKKYLHKGNYTNIIGRLKSTSYINDEGKNVYTTTVVVSMQELGITIDPKNTFQEA